MAPKLNVMTQIVLDARQMYVRNLKGVLNDYAGGAPYMKKPVDPATAQRQLLSTTPEQLAQQSQTDPVGAEQTAQKLSQLQQQNPTPLPAADDYQP